MTAAAAEPASTYITGPLRWMIVGAVMLSAAIEIIDMTIVNVALPHMMGSLGAKPDQIAWVLTSYIVSSVIVMPATGYLAGRFGRRALLNASILSFVAASALCGMAGSIEQMVFFRILQGIAGACLAPLSQSVMLEIFPKEERGKGMAIWTLGVVMAPAFGPTLGGFITEHMNWRWIFYINVPLGAAAFLTAFAVMPDTPRRAARMDWTGLVLMVVGIGGLQLMLDMGHTKSWFQSTTIQISAAVGVLAGGAFVLRSWGRPGAIVDLSLFRDRNFSAAGLVMVCFGFCMFGTVTLQPLMLEGLMGYPAELTGILMGPRALVGAIMMPLVGTLIVPRADPRLLLLVGMVFSALGAYMMSLYAIDLSTRSIVIPALLQGVGMSFLFVPLSTIAYDTLPPEKAMAGAGLYSLMRVMGSSIGISVAATLLSRQSQVHWNTLGEHLGPASPGLTRYLEPMGLTPDDQAGLFAVQHELLSQAQMLAYIDVFRIIAIVTILLAPLVLLMTRVSPRTKAPAKGAAAH